MPGKRHSRRRRQKVPTDKGKKEKQRTGMFTTGIVSQCGDHQIAIFFTGRQHAGENLGDVLRQRAHELEPPIQMCDALSRNIPKELQTILANCLAHGRRYFVDVVEALSRRMPLCVGCPQGDLQERCRSPQATALTRGAVALPPDPQRPDHGRTSRMAQAPIR